MLGSPLKAIRMKCRWCMHGQLKQIRFCPTDDCPLYPYRMGTNPRRKGIGGRFVRIGPENAKSAEQNLAGKAI